MTEHFPFTPPPELVKQWQEAWYRSKVKPAEYEVYIANCAAAWGYQQHEKALLDAMHATELSPS